MTFKVLSLFAGIGGFDLGLERTGGFKTVAFCEIEAGKGAGLAGERSGLWSEFARIIGEVAPRYVIVENVAALLGRGLGDVLGDLASLGYDAEWHCIPASAVGAPHRRDRVWILAYPQCVEQQQNAVQDGCGPVVAGETESERGEGASAVAGRSGVLADAHEVDAQGILGRRDDTLIRREQVERQARLCRGAGQHQNWSVEPALGRVAHGVPDRVGQLRAYGNAVVPQIPELIGRAILEAEAA